MGEEVSDSDYAQLREQIENARIDLAKAIWEFPKQYYRTPYIAQMNRTEESVQAVWGTKDPPRARAVLKCLQSILSAAREELRRNEFH